MFWVKFVYLAVEAVVLLILCRWYYRLTSPYLQYFHLTAQCVTAFHILGAIVQEHLWLRYYSPCVHTTFGDVFTLFADVQDNDVTSLHVACLRHVFYMSRHFLILNFLEHREIVEIDRLMKDLHDIYL